VEGRDWIDRLPAALAAQALLLRRLLDAVERDERFRALELYGSLARGNADADSDVDVRLWIADERWEQTADEVVPLLRRLGDEFDVADEHYPTGRHVFVHYGDGTQIDAVARPAAEAKGRAPEAIALLDRDGLLAEPYERESLHVDEQQRRTWAFWGWLMLGHIDKYLRRGALWEGLDALGSARATLLWLHGADLGAPSPHLGATSIFDVPGADVPEGFAETYALPDADDVRRAARAVAHLLEEAHEPPPIAEWARGRL